LTRQQGKTGISKKLWKKHRRFRITASIAGQVLSLDYVARSLLAKIRTEKDSDLSKVPAIQLQASYTNFFLLFLHSF